MNRTTSDKKTIPKLWRRPLVGPSSSKWRTPRDAASKNTAEADNHETLSPRSLFLCCRGLISLRHIQGLETMHHLKSLSVHMNAIQRVEGLGTLHQLVELDLSANEISELSASDAFQGLFCLKRLNLSSNFIKALPEGVFSSLKSLEWLALGFNRLESLSGLCSIPEKSPLAYVDLCGNRIRSILEVTESLCAHREHLQELRLAIPSPSSMGPSGGGRLLPAQTHVAQRIGVQRVSESVFVLEENPCCFEARATDPSGAAPYVDALLCFFSRLRVLDGVSYAVDPLAPTREAAVALEGRGRRRERGGGGGGEGGASDPTAGGRGVVASLTLEPPSQWPEEMLTRLFHRGLRGAAVERHLASQADDDGGVHSAQSSGSAGTSLRSSNDNNANNPDGDDEADDAATRSGRRRPTHVTPRAGARLTKPGCSVAKKESFKAAGNVAVNISRSTQTLAPEGCLSHQVIPTAEVEEVSRSEAGKATLKWVSCGVNTDPWVSSPSEENKASGEDFSQELRQLEQALRQCQEEKELVLLQVQRGEEKLRLHVATEGDLHRQLELAQRRSIEIEEGATVRARQLTSQVTALKDELNRRSQEVSILHKKHRAALDEQKRQLLHKIETVRCEREEELLKKIEEEAAKHMQSQYAAEEEKEDLLNQMAAYQRELEAMRNELACLERQSRASSAALTKAHEDRQKMEHFFRLKEAEQHERHLLELQAFSWGGNTENSPSRPLSPNLSGKGKESKGNLAESIRDSFDPTQFFTGALRILLSERDQLLNDWVGYQQQCKHHSQAIREHYTQALQDAEVEIQRLCKELDKMRERDEKNRKTLQKMETGKTHNKKMFDAASDPIPAPRDVSIAKGQADDSQDTSVEVVQLPVEQGRAVLSSLPQLDVGGEDSRVLHPATEYWRQVSERLRADLQRLERAHEVTAQTQLTTAKENDRLLEYTAELEQNLRKRDQEHNLEKENLLRTLHNLQNDIAKKADALDTLEEEAKAKISEKRHRIAELEGQVESLQEAQEKQLELHVKYRDEAEARTKELGAACDALRDAQRRYEEEVRSLKARLQGLETGAVAGTQLQRLEQQHQKERSRLIEAIRMAREQLLRLHQTSVALVQQNQEKDVALKKKEQELESCTAKLAEMQQSSRARQKATLDMLSQMIFTDK